MLEEKEEKRSIFRGLWWKIPLFIIIFIFLLILCLPFYSSFLIPLITGPIQSATGYSVQMDKLYISIFGSQISFKDFVVKDKEETILSVDYANLDYNLLTMKSGKIATESILEVSGVTANITLPEIEESTTTTQPTTTQPTTTQPTTTPTTSKKSYTSFPELYLKVAIKDINVVISDASKQNSVKLDNFYLDFNVDTFEKITYRSGSGNSYISDKLNAGLKYTLEGLMNLAMDQQNNVQFHAKGNFTIDDMYVKQQDVIDLEKQSISLYHEISLDTSQGVVSIPEIGIKSKYANFALKNFELNNLQDVFLLMMNMSQWKSPQDIADSLSAISGNEFHATLDANFDLNTLYQDWGKLIATISNDAVTEFGGIVKATGDIIKKENSIVSLSQNFNVDSCYVQGIFGLDQKPYELRLNEVKQNLKFELDLLKKSFTDHFSFHMDCPYNGKNLSLIDMELDAQVSDILQNITLDHWKDKLEINLENIALFIRDFIPSDVKVKGKIANFNTITNKDAKSMDIKGKTDIVASLASNKIKNLPELKINGNRHVILNGSFMDGFQSVDVKKMSFTSTPKNLFNVQTRGNLHMNLQNKQKMETRVRMDLSKLTPYIAVFLPNARLKGIFNQRLIAESKSEKINVRSDGSLKSFQVYLPLEDSKITCKLQNTSWRQNFACVVKDNQQVIEVTQCSIKNPSISLNSSGKLQYAQDFTKTKIDYKIEFPLIDVPALLNCVKIESKKLSSTTQSEEEQQATTIEASVQDVSDELSSLAQDTIQTLQKFGIDFQCIFKKIILDSQNKIENLNITSTLNHNNVDNKLLTDIKGNINSGTLFFQVEADLSKPHPDCHIDYDVNKIPYILSVALPMANSFPLLDKISFENEGNVDINAKGNIYFSGIDPRGIKKSLRTTGDNYFSLPAGRLDVGFDPTEFLDATDVTKKIDAVQEKTKQEIEQLLASKEKMEQGIKTLETSVLGVSNSISNMQSQYNTARATLQKLQGAGSFIPGIKKQVEQAEKQVQNLENQMKTLQDKKTQLEKPWNEEKAKLEALEKEIAEKQATLTSTVQSALPKDLLDCSFDRMTVSYLMENANPWTDGKSLTPYNFTKIMYKDLTFEPKGRKFPKISGWYCFDGTYEIGIFPTDIEAMNALPEVMAQKIKNKGVFMTKDGISLGK